MNAARILLSRRRFLWSTCALGIALPLVGCKPDAADEHAAPGAADPKAPASGADAQSPAANSSTAAAQSPAEAARHKAVAWLLKQQSPDGGWRSEYYGQLKGGAATTSLVMYALSHAPASDRVRGALERGWEFLRASTREKGFVANPDGSADFSTYATALVLLAARRAKLPLGDDESVLVRYLIESQLTEAQGWTPDDVHYGGWDFVGRAAQIERRTTGTNLSITRFVLEALAEERTPQADTARAKAKKWLARCQNPDDGGFAFSPAPGDLANKAGATGMPPSVANSYGTMTCDGILALAAIARGGSEAEAGQSIELQKATRWLAKHAVLDVVPGFSGEAAESGWQHGLRFYYYASLAQALGRLPAEQAAELREKLLAVLVRLQAADGSFANEAAQMREDDPLIATAFAMIALHAAPATE